MPATYVKITDADWSDWLTTAKRQPEELALPGCAERVFFWRRAGSDIGVAVFSSLRRAGGGARGKGEDAIRVVVYDVTANRVLGGSRRVHRTQGWRGNLTDRIREVYLRLPSWPRFSSGALSTRHVRAFTENQRQ